MVVVCGSSVEEKQVAQVLAEEGRRLEAKLQRRADEEASLLVQLQAVCDELIGVEVELDAARSSTATAARRLEEEARDDPEAAQLSAQLIQLKKKVGFLELDELAVWADEVPWRRTVSEACRRRDEAYEWGAWTVWHGWASQLPAPIRDLGSFTDASASRGIDVDADCGEDWLVVEPWRPVADWDYGDTIEDLVEGSIDGPSRGWPQTRPLRRRRWAREACRRRIPAAGALANCVLSLAAEGATSQALCAKLVAQIDSLERQLAESDNRGRQVDDLDRQLAAARADLAASKDGLKRNQLLVAASRRTLKQPSTFFTAARADDSKLLAAVGGLLSGASDEPPRSVDF